MDKVEDLIIYLLFLIICMIFVWLIYNYYHLQRFRECYLNSFMNDYCDTYLNY